MSAAACSAHRVFEKEATFEGWDADYYTPITARLYDYSVGQMLRDLDAVAGERILDAGCGTGTHAARVARAGLRVDAIDISAVALRRAAGLLAQAGVAQVVKLQQADLSSLPFREGVFPRVFSWGVVIHIPEAERALAELARVLAPGGRLALYVANAGALDLRLEKLARFVLQRPQPKAESLPLGRRCWYTLHGESLCVWAFHIGKLVEYLECQGLRLVRRRAGELTEAQRRVSSHLRPLLQRVNNLYARLGLPAQLAIANLLVFEKRPERRAPAVRP